MSAATDPYVKVYYRVADDPRFENVYNNDAALATWLRLLLLADGMWPASAPIPAWCKKSALAVLVEAGLIELGTGYRYRVHGMDAERSRTAEHARVAARGRWSSNPPSNAGGNAPSNAQSMPLNSAQINSTKRNSTQALSNGKEEEPFVTLTDDEKAARRQKDRDELMARTMERLGVKP